MGGMADFLWDKGEEKKRFAAADHSILKRLLQQSYNVLKEIVTALLKDCYSNSIAFLKDYYNIFKRLLQHSYNILKMLQHSR